MPSLGPTTWTTCLPRSRGAGVCMLSDLEHTKHLPERRALADLPLRPHRVTRAFFTANRSASADLS
jgi:hypothetical protein